MLFWERLSERVRYVASLIYVFRDDLLPTTLRWAPERHRLFGPHSHNCVMTILLAHSHIACRHTLGMLPHAVLYHLIGMVLWEGDDVAAVAEHWSEHRSETPLCFKAWKAIYASHESTLNAFMLMKPRAQYAANAILRQTQCCELSRRDGSAASLTTSSSQSSCVDICAFAEARAGKGIRCSVERVHATGGGDYDIHVRFTPTEIATPPHQATFWQNVRSSTLCWTSDDDHSGHTIDGTTHVDELTHVRASIHQWHATIARRQRFLAAKCKKLPRVYSISTYEALYRWEDSMKRILKVEGECTLPIVGLLLRIA